MPKRTSTQTRKNTPKLVSRKNTTKNFFSKGLLYMNQKLQEVPEGTPGAVPGGRAGLRSGKTRYYLPKQKKTLMIVPPTTPGAFTIRVKGVDWSVIEKPKSAPRPNAMEGLAAALAGDNMFANAAAYSNHSSNRSRRSSNRSRRGAPAVAGGAGAASRRSSNSSGSNRSVDDDIMAAFQQFGMMNRRPAKKGPQESTGKNYGNY